MTQAPDEKMVEAECERRMQEMLDDYDTQNIVSELRKFARMALPRRPQDCIYWSAANLIEDLLKHLNPAARPLLEAEIRKDERGKFLREIYREYTNTILETGEAVSGYELLQWVASEHNLDLTTDSKNGEG